MSTAAPSPDDSTDRMAEVTESWESSALTDPDGAVDPAVSGPGEHGDSPDEDRLADAGSADEAAAQRPDF